MSATAAGRAPAWLDERAAWLVVGGLTLVGLLLRLAHMGDTLIGDETSTLWIIKGGGLRHVLSVVSGDAEISPPLYFVLAWFSSKLGSAPELIRLPALIAGVASIPLTYVVGARAVSRVAGLLSAAVMTLSPFMVYYAANARVYSLAIALLLASTLALLIAVRGGGLKAWIVYGALSCLAMYAHYTSAFVLAVQFGWVLWAYPQARRAALLANVGAAIVFVPWIPNALADLDSPTTDILAALQGSGFEVKRAAVEVWAFGSPGARLDQVPGDQLLRIAIIALVVAAGAGLWRHRGHLLGRADDGSDRVSRGMVLVIGLALATPVCEGLLLLAGGTDLFGARNLNTSSGGLALAIGAVLASAAPAIAAICAVLILGTFGAGSIKALDDSVSTINFRDPAAVIDAQAAPSDIVLDTVSSAVSPVPVTPLDAHLGKQHPEVSLYLPTGPPPFLGAPPEPGPLIQQAFDQAEESGAERIFIVTRAGSLVPVGDRLRLEIVPPNPNVGPVQQFLLPRGTTITEERTYEGIGEISLVVVEPGRGAVRQIR